MRNSVNAMALNHALNVGRIVISEPVLQEFEEVIFRKKFDRYFLTDAERIDAINLIERNALFYFPTTHLQICRDPKDNKFLELALSAKATAIVSGDKDLLILNPFENIPILSASDFLKVF